MNLPKARWGMDEPAKGVLPSAPEGAGMVDVDERQFANMPKTEPEMRETKKLQAFDRQMHIQKGIEAGLSREEAEAHADADMQERESDGIP